MEKNGRSSVSRVTIGVQLREAVENRKKHIVAMKAIESVSKVELDHRVIRRHSLLKPASRMDSRLTATRDPNSHMMRMKVYDFRRLDPNWLAHLDARRLREIVMLNTSSLFTTLHNVSVTH